MLDVVMLGLAAGLFAACGGWIHACRWMVREDGTDGAGR